MTTNLINPSIIDQFINYTIVNEKLKREEGWAPRALASLKRKKIRRVPRARSKLTISYLQKAKQMLVSGKRSAVMPAVFKGVPGPRYEKDKMYERFWCLVDLFHKEPVNYCGLAAHQLVNIALRKEVKNAVICEDNVVTYDWLKGFVNQFWPTNKRKKWNQEGPRADGHKLIKQEIFSYLSNTSTSFGIIDLDLMCVVTSESQIYEWAEALKKATDDLSVVSIATCVGRANDKKMYEELMGNRMPEFLHQVGFKEVMTSRGTYLERHHPMSYEHYVLKK